MVSGTRMSSEWCIRMRSTWHVMVRVHGAWCGARVRMPVGLVVSAGEEYCVLGVAVVVEVVVVVAVVVVGCALAGFVAGRRTVQ